MHNALSIDVEDYFMVSAFADIVKFEHWPRHESRVEASTVRILDLLDTHGVKATFFVLGWIAERYPELVQDIHSRGHEVASHGYNHRLVYDLTPAEFRDDLRKSRSILEEITGERVLGYRAASYSITARSLWALDVLIEEGFVYDSSIFPVHHDRYGLPGAKRHPHVITRAAGDILEFPPATLKVGGKALPTAGGGYLRLFPLAVTRHAIRKLNRDEKAIAVVYLHPWEVDPEQPRLKGSLKSRFRHYTNLGSTHRKLKSLLGEFRFVPIQSLIHRYRLPVS